MNHLFPIILLLLYASGRCYALVTQKQEPAGRIADLILIAVHLLAVWTLV